MNQVFAIATLIVGGIMLADILTHPAGVNAAGSSLVGVLKPSFQAMLGSVPK